MLTYEEQAAAERELAEIDTDETAPETEGSSEPLPNGNYDAEVAETIFERNGKGNLQLVWKLRVTDGPFAGRIAWKKSVFTPKAIPYFNKEIAICGSDIRAVECPRRYGELVGLRLAIGIKNQEDGAPSVYINKLLSPAPAAPAVTPQPVQQTYAPPAAAPAAVAYDDDIPF